MEEFKIKNDIFRIRKMNAIEVLAFRTQINFDTYDAAQRTYNLILENMEVQIKDKWIPVKQGNTVCPEGLENDVETIDKLLVKMSEYLNEVFPKSNASKK